jgi:hypothetical protein
MTRHFYKHSVTGLVASLNDSFAEAFGDKFERVGAPTNDTPKTEAAPAKTTADKPEDTASAKTEDTAPKEGDK